MTSVLKIIGIVIGVVFIGLIAIALFKPGSSVENSQNDREQNYISITSTLATSTEESTISSVPVQQIQQPVTTTSTQQPVIPPTSTSQPTSQVYKPKGIFSASGWNSASVTSNQEVQGVLVRSAWKNIEPTPGTFNFKPIDQQISAIKSSGKSYSLAIIAGGIGSPAWLIDTLGAPFIEYSFRGVPGSRLPFLWDAIVQDRINKLAQALGTKYGSDVSLTLVYVSQMTTNGIEGHLQGVDMTSFKNAGYTDDVWVEKSKLVAKYFADSFPTKALAFEVHDVNGGATVPSRIINDLWNDPELNHRVGTAMWWLSGRTTYQPELLDVLDQYPGDIYGQVIAYSGDTRRQKEFGDDGFASVFSQAKVLGVRYIEAWEQEFQQAQSGTTGIWDSVFKDFNMWTNTIK